MSPSKKVLGAALFLSLVLFSGCVPQDAPAPTSTPKAVKVIRDQAYHPDEINDHLLDIYLPNTSEGPFPVLVMIHGGSSDKDDLVIWGQTFARKGVAAVSINHRQWPDHSYPTHLEDAFCALAWIVSSADTYAFDPGKIAVMGHSAGGTLAATLGLIENPGDYLKNCPSTLANTDPIQGVISFTVIFDYQSAAAESPTLEEYTNALLGGSYQDIPEIWQEASPASWVDRNDPPFLLIHGAEDQSISPEQSILAAELLEKAGVPVELLLIPDAGHMQIKSSSQSMQAVEEFLIKIFQ